MIPADDGDDYSRNDFFGTLQESLGEVWKPVLLIWSIAFFRAFVEQWRWSQKFGQCVKL
jgi:hypothetical protein